MTTLYEFRAYAADENGGIAERPVITKQLFSTSSAALARGGRIAKKANGPVDIAVAGDGMWYERYITTASPSRHHAAGWRFERL